MFDLTDSATIKSILSKFNLAPNKFLGQNFLIDQNVLDKIIETADLKAGDNVLEIGPGLGTLTTALCNAGVNVVAIEKDKELIPVLEDNLGISKMVIGQSEPKHPRLHGEPHVPLMHSRMFRFASNNNISIINDDFLQVKFDRIRSEFEENSQVVIARSETILRPDPGQASQSKADTEIAALPADRRITRNDNKDDHSGFNYKVICNIPYYITSPVIRKIFSFPILPAEIVFLVQREVAERIAAPAGGMSLISLYVQFYGKPSVVGIVKPESFLPAPKVESAILKIELYKKNNLFPEQEKELWHLAKIGFSSRRKTLANNLAAGFHRKNSEIKELLKKAGFGENARAQELSVAKWIELLKVMKQLK